MDRHFFNLNVDLYAAVLHHISRSFSRFLFKNTGKIRCTVMQKAERVKLMKCPKHKINSWLAAVIFLLAIMAAGCSSINEAAYLDLRFSDSSRNYEAENRIKQAFRNTPYDSVHWQTADLDESFSMLEATLVTMQGNSIVAEGEGVEIDGSKLLINTAGTYIISGELKDGQIIINASADDTVRIILNGVDLTNTAAAPFYVQNAAKVVVTLAEETVNTFTDGEDYLLPDKNSVPDAAFFSCSDLTINGNGSLVIFGKYKHGLVSKKDLKIINAKIKVNAVEVGIRGSELLAIRDAILTVKAGSDGIQVVSEADPKRGLVVIKGSTIDIYAILKGIVAAENLLVVDGEITIESGSGLPLNDPSDL